MKISFQQKSIFTIILQILKGHQKYRKQHYLSKCDFYKIKHPKYNAAKCINFLKI